MTEGKIAMRYVIMSLLLSVLTFGCVSNNPPEPFGAVPTKRQLIWHNMKYHAFIHFGPNTFTNIEWGHGNESPDIFSPSELDCRQWAKAMCSKICRTPAGNLT